MHVQSALRIRLNPQSRCEGPHGATFVMVDAEGRILEKPWMQSFCDAALNETMRTVMGWFNPTFLAISFLHCRNVQLVDRQMDKPLQKKWLAKHPDVQPAKYKTLIIEPLKEILRTQGRSGEHGIAKAMHICRGHFKDYREGRGLFGKYHQLVWHPMTVRGTRGKTAPPREVEIRL